MQMNKHNRFLIEVRDALKEYYHSHKDNFDQSDVFYDRQEEAEDELIQLVGIDNFKKLSSGLESLKISDEIDIEFKKGPSTKVFVYAAVYDERSFIGFFHNYWE